MASTAFLLTFLLVLSVSEPGSCETELSGVLEPYDLLFDNAVEAYYKQDWFSVILNMERALRNKGILRKVKAQCRLSCANLTAFQHTNPGSPVPLPGAGPVQDLGFFQRVLERAECVSRCEAEKLGPPSMHKVSDEVELEFRKRTPYNYLQVAYFKINKLDKAVAAANTFYVANPDHMEMRQNLEYYSMMAGVQETDFKDLEARPHMAEFLEGKRLYSADNFSSSVGHFEAALKEFFPADAECRALCEGAYDYDGYNYMEYNADLFQSITDHYLYVLNCKQNCAVELASTAGREKPFEDFLPSHFNYLQFSYYNSEQYEKAIECAKTFLLFRPDDEVMKQNLAYYSAILGEEKAAAITAREGVEQYIKNSLLEKELLYFGYEIFGITFVDPDTWTPEEIMPKKLRDKQKADRETAARITEEIGNLMKEIETLVEEKTKESSDITKMVNDGVSKSTPTPEHSSVFDGITVSMTSKALNGSQRVVLDGVITDDECRELHRLSNTAAQKGDGYRGRPSPHSPSEMFQGVTVLKALKLGQEGVLPLKSARLFFDLSEKVRKVVESYFSLQSPLYFSYSHLVCRSAIEEKQEDRDDLSHPVHVDNCLLISELNECMKEPPAYTHRDYSAIVYLNDDFEGGDFIFTELDAKTITAVVKPQCGRIVAFGAGKENPHGVRAVTKGQRCAVALWFTLDPRHNEKERIQAEELLKMLSSPLNAEFQKTEKDRSKETASEMDSAIPDGGKTSTAKGTKIETGEQASKPAEEKTDTGGDTKMHGEDKPPKAMATEKAKAKTAPKTKPAGKAKTKTKAAEKTKAKTAEKKEKAAAKKTVKAPSKKRESEQPKAKSSLSDSQKKNDEL
ncbi:prolyl 3-hydroxylase 1 [Ictalurus punctatus]|uniref:procollagen-proline 3-dioxygenase n=1 Tax=Ictalurus punctatus TaxID=7998 RepID=A0A2D0TB53_ICTPU|nr:prolyl 3-hydroxylase 1 [Ictalurus punctatus]